MTSIRTVKVRIEGGVQGVGYRVWAREQAAGLGLSGWVRNRKDGTVEALFSGPEEAIDEMLRRCKTGPIQAHVDAVTVVQDGCTLPPTGFYISQTA